MERASGERWDLNQPILKFPSGGDLVEIFRE